MKKDIKAETQRYVETIGIDLGNKMSRYCIVNRNGEVVEEGSFRNQVSSIEAGAQSAWISRELERGGQHSRCGQAHGGDLRADVGAAERFQHSRDVAGFLGLRPRQRQSGARDPQLGISKSGDPYLRKLLVQCSHYILGHWGKDSALRRWGLAKSEGGHKATMRAIVVVARKLSVLPHRLWVSGEFYKPFPKGFSFRLMLLV